MKFGDSITTPIVQSSTFVFQDSEDVRSYTAKERFRFEYGRYGHPTQYHAERKLAALEEAEDCLLFASGMNAIVTTFLTFLSQGQHLIITDDVYKKTLQFCLNDLPRWGVECTVVPVGDPARMEAAIRPNTAILFSESPTNPYLFVADVAAIAAIARRHGVLSIIDATFATPYNQRPLAFGVDLVMHSLTKYLGGHNDLLGGAILGRKELVERVRTFHKTMGGAIDAHCCYLLIRGLKTFAVRMERHNRTAQAVAEYLEAHPLIKRVYYPGLPSHPQHRIACEQMKGFGGVVTFEVNGDWHDTLYFLDQLKLCYIAPSLGGVETLITHPASITYYDMTREERLKLNITDELVRLAVGMEDPEDLMADLDQGLQAMAARRSGSAG